MFVASGGPVAHIQAAEHGPPSWCSYLAVDDLDASTALAAEQGGTVLVPPTPLPAGRFSVVTTPSGAALGLYEAVDEDEQATPGPGSVHWVELRSTTPEEDIAWLRAVFGFSHRVQPAPEGPYHVLLADGVPRGGVTSTALGVSMFVAWVQVDDLATTVATLGAQGGRTVTELQIDAAVGRRIVVSDPSGATFGLVQPA